MFEKSAEVGDLLLLTDFPFCKARMGSKTKLH